MRHIYMLFLAVSLVVAPLYANDKLEPQAPKPEKENDGLLKQTTFKMESSRDIYRIAHDLARTFLTEEQFKAKVAEVRERFNDWSRDNEGDAGLYLNCRLLIVGLSASGGKIDKIKDGVVWVALYREFDQPLPSAFLTFASKNKDSLNRVLKELNWETVSTYVKNRQWRQDAKDAETAAKAQEQDTAAR